MFPRGNSDVVSRCGHCQAEPASFNWDVTKTRTRRPGHGPQPPQLQTLLWQLPVLKCRSQQCLQALIRGWSAWVSSKCSLSSKPAWNIATAQPESIAICIPLPVLLSLMKFFSQPKKYGEKLFSKQHHAAAPHLMLILAALHWFHSLFMSVLLYSSTPLFCVQTFLFHCLLHSGPVLIHRNHLYWDKTLTFWPLIKCFSDQTACS